MRLFILTIITALTLQLSGQSCEFGGQQFKPKAAPGIEYSASYGYCYHYNSTTVEAGYKHHFLSATLMNRNLARATMRMQDEAYLGYTYLQPVNKHFRTGLSLYAKLNRIEPVGRFFLDYQLLGPIYLHGSVVQVSDRMTHLIAGLKLVL